MQCSQAGHGEHLEGEHGGGKGAKESRGREERKGRETRSEWHNGEDEWIR